MERLCTMLKGLLILGAVFSGLAFFRPMAGMALDSSATGRISTGLPKVSPTVSPIATTPKVASRDGRSYAPGIFFTQSPY